MAQRRIARAILTRVVALGTGGSATVDTGGEADTLITGTLNANATITLSNLAAGATVTLILTQDGTGSRTLTLSPTPKMPGGFLTLSTTVGAIDVVTCFYDGSTLYAFLAGKAMA